MKENRLVVADIGWSETIPEWLKKEVEMERLMSGMVGLLKNKKQEVGDAEACIYLYTASLTAPIGHNLTRVYIHLCTKLMERRGAKIPNDIAVSELNEDEQRELDTLKRDLYRARGGDMTCTLLEILKEVKKGGVKRVKEKRKHNSGSG